MKDTDESADRYFNPGSTISLKCAVKREVVWDNKWDVDWTKDGELLDIFKRKSIRWSQKLFIKIFISSWSSLGYRVSSLFLISHLTISSCSQSDSGLYSCSLPGNSRSSEGVMVHVLEGEHSFSICSELSNFQCRGLTIIKLITVLSKQNGKANSFNISCLST